MIDLATGQIHFQDGLVFSPHCKAPEMMSRKQLAFPIAGWKRFDYGDRISEYGRMEVGAVCNDDSATQLVILSHLHSYYDDQTPGDVERSLFHEYVVTNDLKGQREFSWGVIHVTTDAKNNRNWIVVVYTPGANVAQADRIEIKSLFEYRKFS
ncbi:MAG: hypothetical protein HC904_13595 [Blastochloris sp.]|nr:hypothetical protein [Blastochloris sp.]